MKLISNISKARQHKAESIERKSLAASTSFHSLPVHLSLSRLEDNGWESRTRQSVLPVSWQQMMRVVKQVSTTQTFTLYLLCVTSITGLSLQRYRNHIWSLMTTRSKGGNGSAPHKYPTIRLQSQRREKIHSTSSTTTGIIKRGWVGKASFVTDD